MTDSPCSPFGIFLIFGGPPDLAMIWPLRRLIIWSLSLATCENLLFFRGSRAAIALSCSGVARRRPETTRAVICTFSCSSSRPSETVVRSRASMPSSVHRAWTLARWLSAELTTSLRVGIDFLSRRSTSRRWAVSRHQPFGWDKVFTKSSMEAFCNLGCVLLRPLLLLTMR